MINSTGLIAGTYISSVSTITNGNILNYSGTGITFDSNLTDFFELVLAALGHDITYDDFSNMSKEQRKSIIRDIKINKILKDGVQ